MTSDTISITEIKEKAIPILKSYPVDKAILFGSHVKGEATKKGDIDYNNFKNNSMVEGVVN